MVLERTIDEERSARVREFRSLLKQRILVLDCAMGTMIQGHGLSEEDYRGNASRIIPETSRETTTCSPSRSLM
jgi:methionine synthase I (cobalamin-dependent)